MKQASRKTKIYVGGFVVGTGLVLSLVVLFVGNDLKFLKERKEYIASFSSTNGLNVGAALKMGGVDIGNVQAISIEVIEGKPRIRATILVYEPYDALVRTESRVTMDTQGVLGDKFLMLTPGPQELPLLLSGANINTHENTELSAVVSKSTGIVDDVGIITRKARDFANQLPDTKDLNSIARNIKESSDSLNEVMKQLNAKGSALRTVSSPEANAQLNATLANLLSASAHLNSVAKKIDEGKGTLGALVNDASLYDDLKTLTGRANRNKAVKFLIQQTLSTGEEPSAGAPASSPASAPVPAPVPAPKGTPR